MYKHWKLDEIKVNLLITIRMQKMCLSLNGVEKEVLPHIKLPSFSPY